MNFDDLTPWIDSVNTRPVGSLEATAPFVIGGILDFDREILFHFRKLEYNPKNRENRGVEVYEKS